MFLALVLLVFVGANGQAPFINPLPQPFDTPGICATRGEFFVTGNLSCSPCSINQVVTGDGKGLIWECCDTFGPFV
jgi:hypothetical protein